MGRTDSDAYTDAYTDADTRADRDWLTYLVQPFLASDVVAEFPAVVLRDPAPRNARAEKQAAH